MAGSDVFSKQTNKPRKGQYFVVGPDQHGGMHGIEIVNKNELTWPGDATWFPPGHYPGRPAYPVMPQLAFDKDASKHKLPRDLDAVSGIWLVSERLKQIFEAVDPIGFVFALCDFTLADGSKGPQYYLCDVTRTIDALNEEASTVRIKIEPSGHKVYSFVGGAKLTFKEEKIGWAHIFRMMEKPSSVICDHVLRDACRAVGMNQKGGVSGLQFRDAANL